MAEWSGKLRTIKLGVKQVHKTAEDFNKKNNVHMKEQMELVSSRVNNVHEKISTDVREVKEEAINEMNKL